MRRTHSLIQSFRLQPKAPRNVSRGKKEATIERRVWDCMEARRPTKKTLKTALPIASAVTCLLIYKMGGYKNFKYFWHKNSRKQIKGLTTVNQLSLRLHGCANPGSHPLADEEALWIDYMPHLSFPICIKVYPCERWITLHFGIWCLWASSPHLNSQYICSSLSLVLRTFCSEKNAPTMYPSAMHRGDRHTSSFTTFSIILWNEIFWPVIHMQIKL